MLMNKRIVEEYRRLESILKQANISEQNMAALTPVLENLAWQKVKLDEARDSMADSAIAIPYDNGGGQSGIRENPYFKGYINLWRAYMVGIEKLTSYLPKELQEKVAPEASSVLDKVKKMKKGKVIK